MSYSKQDIERRMEGALASLASLPNRPRAHALARANIPLACFDFAGSFRATRTPLATDPRTGARARICAFLAASLAPRVDEIDQLGGDGALPRPSTGSG